MIEINQYVERGERKISANMPRTKLIKFDVGMSAMLNLAVNKKNKQGKIGA